MDLKAGMKDLGREVIVNMLANVSLLLLALPYYYVGGVNKGLLVAAMVLLGIICLGTTLWIAQNRKKERVEAKSKLEAERNDHRRELDAAIKAQADLTHKYDMIKRELDEARKSPEDLTRKCENRELELLIQPLFFAFNNYPDDPKTMQREKFGLSMKSSLMSQKRSRTSYQVEKADPVISAMQKYGNLAQPELKGLIRELLEFRQIQDVKGIFSSIDPYYAETEDKVDKIIHLVAARYNELMWSKKDN